MEDAAPADGHVSSFPPEVVAGRRAVASAHRRLAHAFAAHDIGEAELEELAADLERWITVLGEQPRHERGARPRPSAEFEVPVDGERFVTFDERPVSGAASTYGLDVDIRRDGHDVVGRLTLGPAHEGAPNRSHGGIVSLLFDDLFGFVLNLEQTPGFTGQLQLRYAAGTPLGVPLECRVRLDDATGRKLTMSGELAALDDPATPFVTASATFIKVDPEQFRRHVDPG